MINLVCILPFSEGHAVCKSDEFAGLWDWLHGSSPLYTAGGNAGPGKLGGEEVWLVFVPWDVVFCCKERIRTMGFIY